MPDALFVLFKGDSTVEAFLLITADHGGVVVLYFDGAEGEFIHTEVLIFRGASDASEAGEGEDDKFCEHDTFMHQFHKLPMLNLDKV